MTPEHLAARERGWLDGFHGRPPPELHEDLVDAYAEGRRIGTARSGRLPPPRRLFFDDEFCRAVLARPIGPPAPGLDDTAGRHEAGEPSPCEVT